MIGHGVLRVTTVELITGKPRASTQILATRTTVLTRVTRVTEPRHPHAFTDIETLDAFTPLNHGTYDFVTWNDREFGFRQLAIHHMQIGTAYTACLDFNQDLLGPRLW